MTSRERVKRTLTFDNPDRAPRNVWALPGISMLRPDDLDTLHQRFPMDMIGAPANRPLSGRESGQPCAIGTYVDAWGSPFAVLETGVIGEVVDPPLKSDTAMADYKPPFEMLASGLEDVNAYCASTDLFVMAGDVPQPFERVQFLRGSEQTMVDLAYGEKPLLDLLAKVHDFNMQSLEQWVRTDIDGIRFSDDWGSQWQLLISPDMWRDIFKPLYIDYVNLAHEHGKFILMHSDGHIEAIYPDIVEIGADAINSQLFCMDIERLASQFKGKITFWGEIDRQHVLPNGTPQDVHDAVMRVRNALDDGTGGLIAQCEFGNDVSLENVLAVFEAWDQPLA